jgi:hypothetical protein
MATFNATDLIACLNATVAIFVESLHKNCGYFGAFWGTECSRSSGDKVLILIDFIWLLR